MSTVDATCPFVKTAQRKAKDLSNQGYFVVLVGTRDHPEVIGIKEQVESDKIIVAQTTADLAQIPSNQKKIGVIVQTTQTLEKLKEMVDSLLDFAQQIKVINTICNTTKRRQQEARKLAAGVDLMLIVGGKNSANTTHLADIAREVNPNTKHIQSYKEIDKKWLKGIKKVGLSGGASTPHDHILEVKKFLEDC
ncbi:MAG: 4-hydroxy-3-methylbut-2-enyl diphosphate reductase [Actinomycetota bacterium]|nr:4-hydroxy-3-methylbut-2-enyl diphosphate reductase [Actinomycetota bacterium]